MKRLKRTKKKADGQGSSQNELLKLHSAGHHVDPKERELCRFLSHVDLSIWDSWTRRAIDQSWSKMDLDKNGVLTPDEVHSVMQHTLERVAKEQVDIINTFNEMFRDPDVARPHTPAVSKQLAEQVHSELQRNLVPLSREFFGRLDKKHGGRITKAEFGVLFGEWFSKKLKELLKATYF